MIETSEDVLFKEVERLHKVNEKLRAELSEAVKALEPFAKVGQQLIDFETRFGFDASGSNSSANEDFKRAREIWEKHNGM